MAGPKFGMKGQRKFRVKYAFGARHTRTIDPHNRHRNNIPHVVKDVIRISDIVLEIVDARFIDETRHPELEEIVKAQGKKLVFIINKIDLVDIDKLKQDPRLKEMQPYVLFSTVKKLGKKSLRERIMIEAKRVPRDDPTHNKIHVGIIGYPNTGKSSLLNYFVGRGVAGISKVAGFTKGMQKVRLTKDILILDTPGIIPKEEEDSRAKGGQVAKHSKIGVETFDRVKDPDLVLAIIMKEHPGVLNKFYNFETDDVEELLEHLGREWKLFKKGGEVDTDRTARRILEAWQTGKIKKD